MTEQERLADLAKLKEPFPKSAIGQIPRGNVKLDYVGHANVTARLLNVDPLWTWEPFALDADGNPALVRDANGNPRGLWIRLTVCGVTRPGFGSCETNKTDPIKELIGDALRNAAMRFGVALDLWSKEELETSKGGELSAEAHPSQSTQPKTGEGASADISGTGTDNEGTAVSKNAGGSDPQQQGELPAPVSDESGDGGGDTPSSDDPPPATDLVEAYGDGKVLATARRLAKANNFDPSPISWKEISAPLAALVGKELAKK